MRLLLNVTPFGPENDTLPKFFAIVPTMTMTAGHCRIRCDLWKLGWDGCRGGSLIRKVPWSSIEQTEDFCWKNTSFIFPFQALCKVSTSRFFLGGSCESWVMQRWTSFGTHGSEAFTWRSSVTGCFWGPSWRSSWFPGARLNNLPTNLQLLRYDDFSLKDVMEDYGFGIEEIKIRIPGVWGQRWLGTVGVLCVFFSTRCINSKGNSWGIRSSIFAAGFSLLEAFAFTTVPKTSRRWEHPEADFGVFAVVARMQVFWIKWRVKDWWIWSIVNMKLFWTILIFCSHLT